MTPEGTMKIATFNANSIRSRIPIILDWLKKESPDVLGVQEIKVQDSEFPLDAFAGTGYHVIFRGQKAYGGVALFSRGEPQEVAAGLDDGDEPDAPRLIRAVIRGIPIVNTYVPQGESADSPKFQYKLQWLARLRDFFARHYSPDKPLLWMGDFNVAPEDIDVYDPKRLKDHVDFHPEARAALERIREWGFVDAFRKHHPGEPGQYTYYDYRIRGTVERNVGWRVDHIWVTKPLAHACTASWIDLEPRKAERPSDHTFLAAEFDV
jgi:exodeoxyribonuclease-3